MFSRNISKHLPNLLNIVVWFLLQFGMWMKLRLMTVSVLTTKMKDGIIVSKWVNHSHPTICLFIEKMRLELEVDEVKVCQKDIGRPSQKKKKNALWVTKKN